LEELERRRRAAGGGEPQRVSKAFAYAELVRAAEGLRRSEPQGMTRLSREAAIVKVAQLHPELVAAYRAAVPDDVPVVKAESDALAGAEQLAAIRKGADELAASRGCSRYEAMKVFVETDEGVRLREELARAEGR
jgi:hypothetical protein